MEEVALFAKNQTEMRRKAISAMAKSSFMMSLTPFEFAIESGVMMRLGKQF